MTYCLAWKKDNEVYIVADSAVTYSGFANENLGGHTVMGEKHLEGTRNVEERVLKIFRITNKVAITFSGTDLEGRLFVKKIADLIYKGEDPIEAMNVVTTEMAPIRGWSAIVGCYHNTEDPKLFEIKSTGISEIDSGGFVHMGSFLDSGFPIHEIESYISAISKFKTNHRLSLALAFCQSIGQVSDLIAYGVGGIFTGIRLYSGKIEWAPDTLYVLYSYLDNKKLGSLISICYRNDCVIARGNSAELSKFPRKGILMTNVISGEITFADRTIVEQSKANANNSFDTGKYEYMVFFGIESKSTLVLEMAKNLKHKLVSITVEKNKEGSQTILETSNAIRKYHMETNSSIEFLEHRI